MKSDSPPENSPIMKNHRDAEITNTKISLSDFPDLFLKQYSV